MKTQILLSCLLAGGFAVAQGPVYTTPVGYVTEELSTGFNLIGLPVHQPTEVIGTFTNVDSAEVTDDTKDFGDFLTPGVTYILEVTSGDAAGVLQVFDDFAIDTIGTNDDLLLAGAAAGDAYSIRMADTISSVFGPNNESGLQEGATVADADVIWVPDGAGGYDRFYRNEGFIIPPDTVVVEPSWQTVAGSPADDFPLVFTDGLFIERKGAVLDLVVSGEVRSGSTSVVANTGFTLIGHGFATGLTLDNSGMADSVAAGATIADADVVWNPDGSGGYDRYYFNEGFIIPPDTVVVEPSWQSSGGDPAGNVELRSGFFIERKNGPVNVVIASPYDLD